MKTSDTHPFLCQKKPWDQNANPIWLASTVTLLRNIEKFKYPGKLSSDRKKQIISLVGKEIANIEGLANPTLVKAEEIGFLEKEFLEEHFLSTHRFNQADLGEGFFTEDSGEFLAALNLQNHIHLQLIDCRGELENTWSRLVKIETFLGKSLNYAFLPKFGFLTADPTQCGTGLSVAVYLQVPGLVHTGKLEEFLEKNGDESITVSGLQGSPTEIIGDLLMLQNTYTLGLTEENIVSSIRGITTKILVEENSQRNQIQRANSPEFKDKVSRAYGILIHSYQIEAVEALNALSLLKLGANVGWVAGIDNRQLNELFFNCRRAHLLCQFDENISQEQLCHKRAEYIHRTLKNVKLMI